MHHSGIWQAEGSAWLSSELETVLFQAKLGRHLTAFVRNALGAPGRALSPGIDAQSSLHLLPLAVCASAGNQASLALPVAAALQFMLAAGDVLDDIEDTGSGQDNVEQGWAINAATAMILLAEQSIARLAEYGLNNRMCLQAARLLNMYYTRACRGQGLDIRNTGNTRLTEAAYLRIISLKSASQFECACHLGALAGGASGALQREFRLFGRHLGMAVQLANDLAGFEDGSDIAQRKMTLPLIFAINNSDLRIKRRLTRAWRRDEMDEATAGVLRQAARESGALYYTTLKYDIFRRQAAEFLSQAGKAGAETGVVAPFIGQGGAGTGAKP